MHRSIGKICLAIVLALALPFGALAAPLDGIELREYNSDFGEDALVTSMRMAQTPDRSRLLIDFALSTEGEAIVDGEMSFDGDRLRFWVSGFSSAYEIGTADLVGSLRSSSISDYIEILQILITTSEEASELNQQSVDKTVAAGVETMAGQEERTIFDETHAFTRYDFDLNERDYLRRNEIGMQVLGSSGTWYGKLISHIQADTPDPDEPEPESNARFVGSFWLDETGTMDAFEMTITGNEARGAVDGQYRIRYNHETHIADDAVYFRRVREYDGYGENKMRAALDMRLLREGLVGTLTSDNVVEYDWGGGSVTQTSTIAYHMDEAGQFSLRLGDMSDYSTGYSMGTSNEVQGTLVDGVIEAAYTSASEMYSGSEEPERTSNAFALRIAPATLDADAFEMNDLGVIDVADMDAEQRAVLEKEAMRLALNMTGKLLQNKKLATRVGQQITETMAQMRAFFNEMGANAVASAPGI